MPQGFRTYRQLDSLLKHLRQVTDLEADGSPPYLNYAWPSSYKAFQLYMGPVYILHEVTPTNYAHVRNYSVHTGLLAKI